MHERLDTERLVLRMFGNDDLDAYHAICSDREVMEFIGQGKTMTA
ncbi:MAG TPA: GNAT family N-acetyltransferase [Chthoniobacterales bacterium]|nr:GNAT family N-acetyltransferase [Chthoniobacterales bacterium]